MTPVVALGSSRVLTTSRDLYGDSLPVNRKVAGEDAVPVEFKYLVPPCSVTVNLISMGCQGRTFALSSNTASSPAYTVVASAIEIVGLSRSFTVKMCVFLAPLTVYPNAEPDIVRTTSILPLSSSRLFRPRVSTGKVAVNSLLFSVKFTSTVRASPDWSDMPVVLRKSPVVSVGVYSISTLPAAPRTRRTDSIAVAPSSTEELVDANSSTGSSSRTGTSTDVPAPSL